MPVCHHEGYSPHHAYSLIYEALDGAAAYDGNAVPPGTVGTISNAIDRLRAGGGCKERLRRAEAASLAVHHLQWALLNSRRSADDDVTVLRQQIREMADQWLRETILS